MVKEKKDYEGLFWFTLLFFLISLFGFFGILSSYSARIDDLIQETHRVMPDEITLNKYQDCLEWKTTEYFAGFNATEIQNHNFNECYKSMIKFYRRGGDGPEVCCKENKCFTPYESTTQALILNRSYCVKAHEVITK